MGECVMLPFYPSRVVVAYLRLCQNYIPLLKIPYSAICLFRIICTTSLRYYALYIVCAMGIDTLVFSWVKAQSTRSIRPSAVFSHLFLAGGWLTLRWMLSMSILVLVCWCVCVCVGLHYTNSNVSVEFAENCMWQQRTRSEYNSQSSERFVHECTPLTNNKIERLQAQWIFTQRIGMKHNLHTLEYEILQIPHKSGVESSEDRRCCYHIALILQGIVV